MKLWMSSEKDNGVDDSLSIIRNSVEKQINEHLQEEGYINESLKSLDIITILMESNEFDDNKYCEITEYRKRKKDTDFRLRLPYHEFNNADTEKKRKLIYDLLERSIDILEEKGIKNLEKVKDIIKKSRDENLDEYLAYFKSIRVR